MDLWEFHANKFGVFQEVFVVLWSERPKTFLDQIKLIQIILSPENRLTINHLRNNTTNGPNINRLIIVISFQNQFRRAIPSGRNIIGHFPIVRDISGKSKITYFNNIRFTDQYIFRFNISVNDIERMHVSNSFEHLICVVFELMGLKITLKVTLIEPLYINSSKFLSTYSQTR